MVPRQHITPQPEVIRAILLDDSPWEEAHWAMLAAVAAPCRGKAVVKTRGWQWNHADKAQAVVKPRRHRKAKAVV